MNSNNFFPEKVYRCDCLSEVISSCLANNVCSIMDIFKKVNELDGETIFCVKCGENEQNTVLSCSYHMPMAIFAVQSSINDITLVDKTKN